MFLEDLPLWSYQDLTLMSEHLQDSSLVQLSLHSQCSSFEMFRSIGRGDVTTLFRTYLGSKIYIFEFVGES